MTPQQIISKVALYYGITQGELLHGDRHRVYAEPQIHKRQPKPKPKPVEPMYREIPKHKASVFTVDQNEAELKRQRLSLEKAHPKPWYLGKR